MCYGSSDPQVLSAFYASTAALLLLPLFLVGGFVFWISRASKRVVERGAAMADGNPAGR